MGVASVRVSASRDARPSGTLPDAFKEGPCLVDGYLMRPRFGTLTRVLAGAFVLAGIGAGIAGLSAGDQSTPGHAWNREILLALALTNLVVGASLWMEYPWAWWVGLGLTSFTVVMDLLLHAIDGGWMIWSVFLVLFAVSAAQGRRDRLTVRRPDAQAG